MNSNTNSSATLSLPVFVQRLGSLPVVDGTLQRVGSLYASYAPTPVKSAVSRVEGELASLYTTRAAPWLSSHQDALKKVDEYACAGLDKVEQTTTSVRTRIDGTTKAATDYTATMLRALETSVCAASDAVLRGADHVVDATLTPVEGEPPAPPPTTSQQVAQAREHEPAVDGAAAAAAPGPVPPPPPPLGADTRQALQHAGRVYSKARTRAFAHAVQRLQHVRNRSTEALQMLKPYTVDLLAYAREHLDQLADEADADETTTAAATTATPPMTYAAAAAHDHDQTAVATTVRRRRRGEPQVASVAGSNTAGAVVARAQRASRRAVRTGARQLRTVLQTCDAAVAWTLSAWHTAPLLVADAGQVARSSGQAMAGLAQAQLHHAINQGLVLRDNLELRTAVLRQRAQEWRHAAATVGTFALTNSMDLIFVAQQSATNVVITFFSVADATWQLVRENQLVRDAERRFQQAIQTAEVQQLRQNLDGALNAARRGLGVSAPQPQQ